MNHSTENPGVTDLREMDVLRFLFELKREEIDPMKLQQMLIEHQIQNQVRQLAKEQQANSSGGSSSKSSTDGNEQITLGSPFNSMISNLSRPKTSDSLIPEPKIVFNYVPTPKYPTPEPEEASAIDYRKAKKKAEDFHIKDRSQFIKLRDDLKTTPTNSSRDSDSDQENLSNNSLLPKLTIAPKINIWRGSSIYNNLPEVVMSEYDKMLRECHSLKVEVVDALNNEFPVSYDYNPKKSRVRTNYSDPQIADDRTRNNVASRRSRQRKKFQTQMIQYAVDYDLDENFLLAKQEKWLKGIIANLEQKIISDDGGIPKLKKLRKQCGFE